MAGSETDAEYVMFIDADLIGLKESTLKASFTDRSASGATWVYLKGRGLQICAEDCSQAVWSEGYQDLLVSLVKHMDISRLASKWR